MFEDEYAFVCMKNFDDWNEIKKQTHNEYQQSSISELDFLELQKALCNLIKNNPAKSGGPQGLNF